MTQGRRLFATVGALAAVAVTLAATRKAGWFQSNQAVQVYDARAYEIASSVDVAEIPFDTLVDLDDRVQAGLPPPEGFTITQSLGRVKASRTGLILPSGEEQLIVTILDEEDDLVMAQLAIDDAVVFTADAANGALVSRNGMAIATLPAFVSDATTSVKASWTALDGHVNSNEVRIP